MKNLTINCAACDTRHVTESTLQSYGKILINCAMVLTTPQSKERMSQYNVSMNCANVVCMDEDVQLVSVNGRAQISPADAVKGKKYLVVNGEVTIAPGTQQVLQQYVGIVVNGKITYPESLAGALGMMKCNGVEEVYPDGAVVLPSTAAIDRIFALRAKNTLYWSSKRMIFTDPQLDAAVLEAKGASFRTNEVIGAESLVERLLPMIDDRAQITIVPDGTVVVDDDVKLAPVTLRRYGSKLYILGDVQAEKDAASALEQMEYLHICGDARLADQVVDLFFQKADQFEGDVEVLKGTCLKDMPIVKISRWMLDREPDGITITDCAMVKLDEDVDKDTILQKLTITDCAMVKCSPQQADAVTMVCQDVAAIKAGGHLIASHDGDEADEEEVAESDGQTVVINCAEYTL